MRRAWARRRHSGSSSAARERARRGERGGALPPPLVSRPSVVSLSGFLYPSSACCFTVLTVLQRGEVTLPAYKVLSDHHLRVASTRSTHAPWLRRDAGAVGVASTRSTHAPVTARGGRGRPWLQRALRTRLWREAGASRELAQHARVVRREAGAGMDDAVFSTMPSWWTMTPARAARTRLWREAGAASGSTSRRTPRARCRSARGGCGGGEVVPQRAARTRR